MLHFTPRDTFYSSRNYFRPVLQQILSFLLPFESQYVRTRNGQNTTSCTAFYLRVVLSPTTAVHNYKVVSGSSSTL